MYKMETIIVHISKHAVRMLVIESKASNSAWHKSSAQEVTVSIV